MNLLLILTILVLALSTCARSTIINATDNCDPFCGKNRVPYPFGFSDSCGIRLNCSSLRQIQIGGFAVQNITADQILVTFPASCNRSMNELHSLFGPNFAPTWRNGLLFDDCASSYNDCVVPSRLVRSPSVGLPDCGIGSHMNISCYSGGTDNGSELMDYEEVTTRRAKCNVVFSSILVDLHDGPGGGTVAVSSSAELDFEVLELGWWVSGQCNCDPNANCRQPAYRGREGYRCTCNEGYDGDGFPDGTGCRKVSDCNARRYMSGRCGSVKLGILVGVTVGGAASLIAILAIICYCMRKRSRALKSRLSAKNLLSQAAGNSNVAFYPCKEIERATNGFSEKQRLGTGAYGTVYAGKLHNDEWVAIKKIRYRDRDSVEQVMNEIKLLSSVSHPNLVRLLGCCIENGEQILVYEYMPNGTLSQHLQRERGSVLPWTIRLTIAAETAHAIAHLHSSMSPPIYHRDIKSSNILLDYNFNSKVADFGLSRFGMMDDSHVSTAPQGTPGYVDPQYHQNYHLSDKSDVYSFGVVLVEIITAMKVVDFSRPHSEINLASLAIERIRKGRIDEIIDPFLEPNRDAWTLSSVHKVAELAFRCLAYHRDMRPSMMEVADELEQIRLSGWAPLDENVCLGSSVASSCSSPYNASEKSLNTKTSKKGLAVGSRRSLVVSQRAGDGEAKEGSPVSVQDVWLIEHSSPLSTNRILGN